jgi:hypothetical protein
VDLVSPHPTKVKKKKLNEAMLPENFKFIKIVITVSLQE